MSINEGRRGRRKVCHVSSVHKVNDIRVFHKECATLADAGFDVTLIGVEAEVPDRGVKVITLPNEGSRFQRMVVRARTAYRYALDVGADLYHFHDVEMLPYALMLKRQTGAKVVFDSHECFREDVVAKHWIPKFFRPTVGFIVGGVEDFVVRRIDQVVAATPHIQEIFEREAQRVITVNNYPIADEFSAVVQKLHNDRRSICYVGAISFARGIIPLLDSLSYIDSSVTLDVAGPFAGKEVEEACYSHPNWGRVFYHGQVSRNVVAQIYSSAFAGMATLLPVPNHILSKPIKLFEYMSAGVPVICSDFPLWQSLIATGGCGKVVDPIDPKAIATAVEALRLDPIMGSNMGRRGIDLVRNEYNWGREGCKLVETYDALLS
ncbi:MAG: glycosyltransferase [Qipengyuania citrea]|uniref:glycosyltransferase n=1 Tax=Alphaproteobacteria TaxID=28211 RepID=UPI003263678A